jgi:hypothetical protein
MPDSDCKTLLRVLQTFIGFGPNHDARDLADLFDLLGRLEPADKAAFWTWLGENHPPIRHWLSSKRVPSG